MHMIIVITSIKQITQFKHDINKMFYRQQNNFFFSIFETGKMVEIDQTAD